jgi:hypothetical protein
VQSARLRTQLEYFPARHTIETVGFLQVVVVVEIVYVLAPSCDGVQKPDRFPTEVVPRDVAKRAKRQAVLRVGRQIQYDIRVLALKRIPLAVIRLMIAYDDERYIQVSHDVHDSFVHLQNGRDDAARRSKACDWRQAELPTRGFVMTSSRERGGYHVCNSRNVPRLAINTRAKEEANHRAHALSSGIRKPHD